MTTAHWQDTAPLTHTDVVVLDYLAALWAESEDLSPDLRDELMAAVTEYVAMRRTATSVPLTDPEQVLWRLGPPQALVAAARRGQLPYHLRRPALVGPPATPAAAGAGASEYAALALLTGGAFLLPVVGPFAGLLLASGSSHWTPAQKGTAWILSAGSTGSALILMLIGAFAHDQSVALLLAFLALVAGPVVAGVSLVAGLRDRVPHPRG
jgi:hypothetical protein